MRRRFSRCNPKLAGFTLIELLVVIVILGILMAVAIPAFVGQQTKAQDSRTQEYLTTAYKAIRTGTPDTGNQYPSSTSMVSWVQQSEPELTVQRGDCLYQVSSTPQDAVLVDPSSTATSLQLCARSKSGRILMLNAPNAGVQTFTNALMVNTFEAENMTTLGNAVAYSSAGASSGHYLSYAWTNTATTTVTTTGDATGVSVRAYGSQCQGTPHLKITLDGTIVLSQDITSTSWGDYYAAASIPAGTHTVSIAFTNDFSSPPTCDRNLDVDSYGFFTTH